MNKEKEDLIVEMKVRRSEIEKDGIIRMNKDTLSRLLGDDENGRITISTDDKTIIRKAIGDETVKKDEIFIRPDTRKLLNVDEGDMVLVEDYDTISEEVKERLGDAREKTGENINKIRSKLGKSITKIKERFKKEEEEE